MPIRKSSSLALAVLVICGAARPAAAAPISCFNVVSLQELISLGSEGCAAGSREFYDFTYSVTPSGGALAIPASDVRVDFPGTRFGQPVIFTGDWTVNDGQSLDLLIEYRFAGIRVTGAGVGIIADIPPSPERALVLGLLCMGAALPTCDGGTLFHLSPEETTTISSLGGEGAVELSLLMSGEADNPVGVNSVLTTLAVPEPTLLLLMLASVGLRAVHARRRRHTPVVRP